MGKNYYSMYNKNKSENTQEISVAQANAELEDHTEEKQVKTETKKICKAHIVDCTCLNVRAETDIHSAVVGIISAGDEVIVDEANSCDMWCAVELKNKTHGHSMRKFLKML